MTTIKKGDKGFAGSENPVKGWGRKRTYTNGNLGGTKPQTVTRCNCERCVKERQS